MLVDLERHQVIDLLADRETASVVAWLAQHPEVEVITRDRSTAYQEAATLGAPQAQQIADRWHLLKNVRETLERYLLRKYDMFKAIAKTLPLDAVLPVPVCRSEALPSTETSLTPSGMRPPTARQQARFAAVKTKLQAGFSIKAVAREVGVALGTVQKYLHLEQHPGNARAWSRPAELAPFFATGFRRSGLLERRTPLRSTPNSSGRGMAVGIPLFANTVGNCAWAHPDARVSGPVLHPGRCPGHSSTRRRFVPHR